MLTPRPASALLRLDVQQEAAAASRKRPLASPDQPFAPPEAATSALLGHPAMPRPLPASQAQAAPTGLYKYLQTTR